MTSFSFFFVLISTLLVAHTGAFAPHASTYRLQPTTTAGSSTSTALQMGILSRFRRKKKVLLDPIEMGAPIPNVDVQILSDEEIVPIGLHEALGNGTSILIGMPGAFTTTCTKTHLPGYIEHADTLKTDYGVETIAVVTTNDKFVNNAWAKEVGLVSDTVADSDESTDEVDEGSEEGSGNETVSPPVTILADGDSELVKELGLVEDMGFGVGIRSKRFALVVENGVAKHLETDEGMDDCSNTSAENLLKVLTPLAKEEDETALDEMEIDENAGYVLAGVAFLVLWAYASAGDGGSAAATASAVAPASVAAAGSGAVDTGMSLLNTYR